MFTTGSDWEAEYVFTIASVIEKYLGKIPNLYNCFSLCVCARVCILLHLNLHVEEAKLNNEVSHWDHQKFTKASCISRLL